MHVCIPDRSNIVLNIHTDVSHVHISEQITVTYHACTITHNCYQS